MLNQRQERFIQNTLLGKSATKAAEDSGYSPKTAYSIGARLLKKVEIQQRLAALQLVVSNGNVATVTERKEKLTEVIRVKLPDKVSAKERILATSELNKMGGDYAPEKHAVLGDIEITIVHKDK